MATILVGDADGWFGRLLLRLGPGTEVLSPPELGEAGVNVARRSLSAYVEDGGRGPSSPRSRCCDDVLGRACVGRVRRQRRRDGRGAHDRARRRRLAGWRSAFEGAAAAIVVLAVLVGVVGLPLVRLVPLNTLRVVIGGLLLVLGLNWLRKAILRASGHKALHDENAIYAETVSSLSGSPAARRDAVGFTVAFKGLLEGVEVVLIVLTLGSSSRHLALAAVSAAAAVVVVGTVGAIVGRQLSEVPENTMKMVWASC